MNGLKFIIGEIGCGKSYELIGRIRSAAEKNANTILIVPEQFSSAAEQKLYNALGIRLFNRIHVETFSRIKRALRREIHNDHVIPDDAAKAAVMYAVRRELADAELKCYGKPDEKSCLYLSVHKNGKRAGAERHHSRNALPRGH